MLTSVDCSDHTHPPKPMELDMPNWAKINLLHRGIRASLGGDEGGGGGSPDANTLYSFPLQNDLVDDVEGNDAATLMGANSTFIADAGPFGAGDYCFDAAQDSTQGHGTKGAQVAVEMGIGEDWTMEGWFYFPEGRTDNQFQHIFDIANAGFTNEVNLFYNDAGGSYGLGQTGDGILDNISPVAQDTWWHIVQEYDSTNNRVIWGVGGDAYGYDTVGANRDHSASTFGMAMGNTNMAGDNKDFNGYIAHVRISDIRRYEMTAGGSYTPPTAPFPLV